MKLIEWNRKPTGWFISGLLGCMAVVCLGAAQEMKDAAIDMEKALSSPATSFVKHVIWPTNHVTEKGVSKPEQLLPDIAELSETLKRVLRKDVLPSDDVIKNKTIGVPELYGRDDYLLLRYTTSSGLDIEIQEGKWLYILVSSPEWTNRPLPEVVTYVQGVAFEILNYPKKQEDYVLHAGASSIDIGLSKKGAICYGNPNDEDWFFEVYWWSDGRRVLLRVQTMTKTEIKELQSHLRPPKKYLRPRRFAFREQEEKSE